MSLSKEIEKLKQDKRLTDYHVSRGKMTKAEVAKQLAALPDLASNVEAFKFSELSHSSGGGGGLLHAPANGSQSSMDSSDGSPFGMQ